jgi:hypothetical protein
MLNNVERGSDYINRLADFIYRKYNINAASLTPAKRGYYGETWKLETAGMNYFIKLDYFSRHQRLYQNSLTVVNYLCNNGIDFIGRVVSSCGGTLFTYFDSAVLGVFDWIDGENIETDETKPAEYQLLCKVYPLTKQGFDIPSVEFSNTKALLFYDKWEKLKNMQPNEANTAVKAMLEKQSEPLLHNAERLTYFASVCEKDTSGFYLTHGDAGGNFFTGKNRNYIVDWDEVMYAPLERDGLCVAVIGRGKRFKTPCEETELNIYYVLNGWHITVTIIVKGNLKMYIKGG